VRKAEVWPQIKAVRDLGAVRRPAGSEGSWHRGGRVSIAGVPDHLSSRSDIKALKVSGSGPMRSPVARRFNCPISSSSRVKSKMSMFWRMRAGVTDLGMAMFPSCMCQRSTTCAGDFCF
jgi:hypothetical protein